MKEKIYEIIKEKFQANVLDILPTSGGYSHEMYFVKIDKEPNEVLVRFSNNSELPEKDLKKELWISEQLKSVNVPIAKIIYFKERENKKDHDIIILEKLNGARLDTIWDNLTKIEKSEIMEEIGKLAKKIHSIKLSKFGRLKAGGEIEFDKPFKFKKKGEKKPHNEFIRALLKEHMKEFGRLLSYDEIDIKFLKDIFDYIAKNKSILSNIKEPVLIHGDFVLGHIFVEKQNNKWQITGLIDFEFAEAYAPEYEFLKLHRAGIFEDKTLLEALKTGYGPINEKAVEVCRVLRDMAFMQVLLESGDNEGAEKVMQSIKDTINKT